MAASKDSVTKKFPRELEKIGYSKLEFRLCLLSYPISNTCQKREQYTTLIPRVLYSLL